MLVTPLGVTEEAKPFLLGISAKSDSFNNIPLSTLMFTHLTADDLLIARRLFALEMHQRDGQNFENFFTRIMTLHNVDFSPVKPQGSYGDRKNDGFIQSAGIYYQVYAPEDPEYKQKETIDKLVTDYAGLHKYWNSTFPIKEYYFVFNDKYKGAYPTLYKEMGKIQKKYKLNQCKPFLAHQLEDVFLKLPHDQIEATLGKVPSAENISLNVSVLNEVVQHLISIRQGYSPDIIPVNPDFHAKITFNGLNGRIGTFLQFGSFQEGTLKDWFKVNSTFSKDNLRQTFNNLYKEGLVKFDNSTNKADLIFFHILKNAYPDQSKVYQDAVIVLMAYFFGYCDIYEEPPVQQKTAS